MVRDGRHAGRGPRGRGWHGPGRGARCRWQVPGGWEVHARVERFVEPALLLVLRDGESHGYDLADAVAALTSDDPVDLGNLYRLLRALEEERVVTSRWRTDLPGRAKRTYELTNAGRALLDGWVAALREAQTGIAGFLARYDRRVKQDDE